VSCDSALGRRSGETKKKWKIRWVESESDVMRRLILQISYFLLLVVG